MTESIQEISSFVKPSSKRSSSIAFGMSNSGAPHPMYPAFVQHYCNCKFIMSTGTLLVADHICSIIIPTEELGQMT